MIKRTKSKLNRMFSNPSIDKVPSETTLKINKKTSSDGMFFSWLLTNIFIGLLIYLSFIIVVFT